MSVLNTKLPEPIHRSLRMELARQNTTYASLLGQLAGAFDLGGDVILFRSIDYDGEAEPFLKAVRSISDVYVLIEECRRLVPLAGTREQAKKVAWNAFIKHLAAAKPPEPIDAFAEMIWSMLSDWAEDAENYPGYAPPDDLEEGEDIDDYKCSYQPTWEDFTELAFDEQFDNDPRFDQLILAVERHGWAQQIIEIIRSTKINDEDKKRLRKAELQQGNPFTRASEYGRSDD